MAFRRSPVRSRSGPPTFAHDRRRRLPTVAQSAKVGLSYPRTSYGWQAKRVPHTRRMSTVARRAKVDDGRSSDERWSFGNRPGAFATQLWQRLAFTGQSFQTFPNGGPVAPWADMDAHKRFVYILRNEARPPRYYTGLTSDVAARVVAHNAGHSTHTATGRPWRLDVAIEFSDERRAIAFERYLKSGSGVAFSKRHLRSEPNPHS